MHSRARLNLGRCWAALGLLGAILLGAPGAGAGQYIGAATFVDKQSGQPPAADAGTVVCDVSANAGIGGACIPFGPSNSLEVVDAVMGHDVAFQVCVDNNGDGICTSLGGDPIIKLCLDFIAFSHNDRGQFLNPIGPLPTGFNPGCSGGFHGYVVFLCEGVHADAAGTHVHPATEGMITPSATHLNGFGDFCGGNRGGPPVEKRYTVVP